MKFNATFTAIFSAVLVLVLPFVGGGGSGLLSSAVADSGRATPPLASTSESVGLGSDRAPQATSINPRMNEVALQAQLKARNEALTRDSEHGAQRAVPAAPPAGGSYSVKADGSYAVTPDGSFAITYSAGPGVPPAGSSTWVVVPGYGAVSSSTAISQGGCPGDAGGGVGGAPGASSAQGVAGTTSDDLASFAYTYNSIRVANCLEPIPYGNFYYDSCMEARLFWMAESPSPDPADAWGHMGSVRIDGVPSTGCDGNLAGGSGNSGATVADKWWNSSGHRASLYRPGDAINGVCIGFAMTHGGIDEPYDFTRAAARWTGC